MTRLNFTIQESSPLITYSGVWLTGSPANDSSAANYSGGLYMASSAENATASFVFTGSAVSLFGAVHPNYGGYSVTLDQQPPFVSPGAAGETAFNRSLWHADNLQYTEHTVVLANRPTPDRKFLDLDSISIERQIGQDGDQIFQTMFDDTSPTVHYSGSWQKRTGRSTAYQGTLHTTSVANSQVVVTFQGCCVELYGHYANAQYTAVLDNQPAVITAGRDIDLSPSFRYPQALLYLIDGLSEDKHTVTLTNVESNVKRPFFFDYAVVSSTRRPPPELSSTGSHKSPPIGKIVGASMGGVILIAVVILLFLFIRRRNLRRGDKGYPMDLVEEPELEPQPFVRPVYPASQDTEAYTDAIPQGRHQIPGESTRPSKHRQVAPYHPGSTSTSQDALLGSHERNHSRQESSSQSVAPSTSVDASMSSASASQPVSMMPGRSNDSDIPSRQAASQSIEHSVVQEEDAGSMISPEDIPMTSTLPPAYNAEWRRQQNRD